jgi:IS30 family transposase
MIMTCVERKSGFLITAKLKDVTSARLNAAKERAFRIIPPKLRQTLTVDNVTLLPTSRTDSTISLLTKADFALQM